MRLHRLELTALGPFAGSHVVDLDGLGTDGLFLLHGETGAGKSSVLDAIAYALFGVVPGVRQKAHRLRCDRADPWTATSVRLELTVAGHRVRVRRTHDWLRPKRRGTGSTREPATALLEERRKDVWVGLSTRIDEVSHQLLDWIGMSAEQFFQVVLLPQGEFAQFLLAESKDRERLLERLFGTERFSDVQRWLTDRQVDCRLRAEAGEATMRAYVNRLGQELGLPVVDEATFRGADETWRAAQVAGTGVRAAVSLQAAAEADQARVEARTAYDELVLRRRLQDRLAAVERERAALAAAALAARAADGELAAARRAASVAPLLAGLDRAQTECEHRRQELTECGRSASAALSWAGESPVDPADARALVRLERRLREQCGRLTELAQLAQERLDLLAETAAAQAQQLELTALAEQAASRRRELPALIESLAVRAGRAAVERARRPGLTTAERTAREDLAAARAAADTSTALADDTAAVQAAVDRHQQATALVLDLREQRLAGMAAELAGHLESGQPCPVCGSAAHPAPADPAGAAVTRAHEQQAEALQAAAASERAAAERQLAIAQAEHAGWTARSAGRSVAEASERLAAASGELARATAAAAEAAALDGEVGQRRAEFEQLATLIADAESESAQLAERAAGATRAVLRIEQKVVTGQAGAPSVEQRIGVLEAAADAVAQWTAAVAAERAGATALTRAEQALAREAERAGFPDPDAAAAAARSTSRIVALEQAVAAFQRREAALAATAGEPGLDDPELLASLGRPIDLGPSQAAVRAAEEVHTAAAGHAVAARRRAEEVRRLAGRLAEAEQQAAPIRQEYADVRALADLVAGQGQNTRNMTLRAYVLASRLAEVAESASRRLREMSGGRYTFEHTDLADSRRVKAGLGLVIVDDYSGLARSTKTLSGGETFLASLALALGLADVVTAEAGGVAMDTLFIDEGFGSLDADTLEQVMSTLDELRAGGRVVGVVSHVEEMRARIPSRLHVLKRRDGSTLEQISA